MGDLCNCYSMRNQAHRDAQGVRTRTILGRFREDQALAERDMAALRKAGLK